MIALQVDEIKDFMGKLLTGEVFDNFLLVEMDVVNASTIQLSGRRNRGWYDDGDWEEIPEKEYLTWREMRPVVYQLIKGHRTPLSMKGVLMLSRENTTRILEKNKLSFTIEQVGGLFLNIRFESGKLQLVTGVSMNGFVMDKSLERQWDQDMKVFLKHHEIVVEEI